MGADPDQTIFNNASCDLLLPPDEIDMIPRSAKMCHTLALYERLSWHRSKRLVENGQKPYENVLGFSNFGKYIEFNNKSFKMFFVFAGQSFNV